MKFGIVVFPGSNGDHDAYHAVKHVLGQDAAFLWHRHRDLAGADAIVLPGGFAHGDHLRPGALARLSPILQEIQAFARAGGPVLGICNGFQVLLEAGLLPGALLPNQSLRFVSRDAHVVTRGRPTRFTSTLAAGTVLRLPIAHASGNYFADDATLDALEAGGRVVLRWCDADGNVCEAANPNGSARGITGISNESGNVLGLMPHPERACEELVGGVAGRAFFEAVAA